MRQSAVLLVVAAFGIIGGAALIGVWAIGLATRLLADAWAWDRKTPATDICPLVSVTEALWGHMQNAPLTDAGVWVL